MRLDDRRAGRALTIGVQRAAGAVADGFGEAGLGASWQADLRYSNAGQSRERGDEEGAHVAEGIRFVDGRVYQTVFRQVEVMW